MDNTTILQFACVAVLALVASATDLHRRKIPNWLTVTAAIAGLAFHISTAGVAGLWLSLGGFAVGFGILLVLWLIGGGGAGDVKLMGAVGAWLGPMSTLMVFIASVIFAILCLTIVTIYAAVRKANDSEGANAEKQSVLKMKIPYAVPCGLSIWSLFLVRFFTQQ